MVDRKSERNGARDCNRNTDNHRKWIENSRKSMLDIVIRNRGTATTRSQRNRNSSRQSEKGTARDAKRNSTRSEVPNPKSV